MINKSTVCIITFLIFSFFTDTIFAATYYPDDGDLWYDGYKYADSILIWNAPGGWSKSDSGYEHDFLTSPKYFTYCKTSSNLPNKYDDCPTAGVSESSSEYWAFSFGSYHAKNIKAKTAYWGVWYFSSGSDVITYFYLNGQEVYHQLCWWDSIWCMGGIRSVHLLEGLLYRTVPYYKKW